MTTPCDFYTCECLDHDCVEARMNYLMFKGRGRGTGSKGLWADPSVPKRNWMCVEIEDKEVRNFRCEMCMDVDARYVHTMEHPRYHTRLSVGCICAGYMEGYFDKSAQKPIKDRKKLLLSRSARRERCASKKWKVSAKGNEFTDVDGKHAVVVLTRGLFSVSIDGVFLGDRYLTSEAAKYAAFDFINPKVIRIEG